MFVSVKMFKIFTNLTQYYKAIFMYGGRLGHMSHNICFRTGFVYSEQYVAQEKLGIDFVLLYVT